MHWLLPGQLLEYLRTKYQLLMFIMLRAFCENFCRKFFRKFRFDCDPEFVYYSVIRNPVLTGMTSIKSAHNSQASKVKIFSISKEDVRLNFNLPHCPFFTILISLISSQEALLNSQGLPYVTLSEPHIGSYTLVQPFSQTHCALPLITSHS